MRHRLAAVAIVAVTVLLGLTAGPARAADLGDRSASALEALSEAAAGVVVDDRARVEDATDRALAEATAADAEFEDVADSFGRRKSRIRRRIERLRASTAAAAALLAVETTTRLTLVRALERAAREASRLRRQLLSGAATTPAVYLRPRSAGPVRRSGGRFRLTVLPRARGGQPRATAIIGASLPADLVLAPKGVRRDGPAASGRQKVRLVGGVGAARVDALLSGERASLWLVVRGPDAALAAPLSAVADLDGVRYTDPSPSFRVGAPAALAAPKTGAFLPDTIGIAPALPDGLAFDAETGAVSGLPTSPLPPTTFIVTATKGASAHTAELRIDVAPALPEGIAALEDGFHAELFLAGAAVPVKMDVTADGRLLFSELGSGNIRVVSAAGSLLGAPFATLPIAMGGERGLLGLAVAPDFATSGHVFAFASTPAGDGHAARNRVVRFTANGDVGADLTVILDDLPIGAIHNGGGLAFGPDGHLYVSVGDATVEANAQTDGARAGKILRIARDGSFPADNPIENDPEWCRGLRNPFDLTFHPLTGGLYISENGPTANDELNFGQRGKNFEWGPVPPDLPEFLVGFRIKDWTPVIVPTGITFLGADTFGDEFTNDLFLCSYDHAEVRRIVLSGSLLTDLDEEVAFLRFDDPEAIANKPLDVVAGAGGWLYVSTFTAIWRVRRWSDQ